MSVRTKPWPPGVPSWVDLSCPDPGAAGAFYAAVLGWTVVDTGLEFDDYRLGLVEGGAAAGIGSRGGLGWTLYLATDDLDATLTKVRAAGGHVLAPAMDIGDTGRRAVVADPTGTEVGLWQAGAHPGAEWVNSPGAMIWEDLRCADPAVSMRFYADVFGWTFQPLFDGYGTVTNPDAPWPVGGLGPLWGGQPGWLVYFAVADVDVAISAALGAGGSLVREAEDTPYGRMGQIADPDGIVVALMSANPDRPQPTR
ncbi:MAG: VOC family protein [Janthinobacterium lividum]